MEFPDFRLDGRVALLTGAGRGIGLGMARALAAAGCAVVLQDIEVEVAQAAAREIDEAGGRAIALGGDIADLSLPPRLVEQTVAQLGGLHILINNAAIQQEVSWLEVSTAEIERDLRADLIAPLLLCREAVPHLRAQGYGRILNLGSIQGKGGNPHMLPYSMSKAALVNMTLALARDLAPHAITVNLLAPGYFKTYRNREQMQTPEEEAKLGRRFVPLQRVGYPQDCGGLALLLCSAAGSYITGQTIYVDGGMSAS
jgi:NAD(P)-dependent dehydrogenase (short-subunit alcohol dehydrogenase family)